VKTQLNRANGRFRLSAPVKQADEVAAKPRAVRSCPRRGSPAIPEHHARGGVAPGRDPAPRKPLAVLRDVGEHQETLGGELASSSSS
jgi:hypothetical protein